MAGINSAKNSHLIIVVGGRVARVVLVFRQINSVMAELLPQKRKGSKGRLGRCPGRQGRWTHRRCRDSVDLDQLPWLGNLARFWSRIENLSYLSDVQSRLPECSEVTEVDVVDEVVGREVVDDDQSRFPERNEVYNVVESENIRLVLMNCYKEKFSLKQNEVTDGVKVAIVNRAVDRTGVDNDQSGLPESSEVIDVVVVEVVVGRVIDNQSGLPECSEVTDGVKVAIVNRVVDCTGVDNNQSGLPERSEVDDVVVIEVVVGRVIDDQSGLPGRSEVADEVHADIIDVRNEARVAVVDNIVDPMGVDDDKSGSSECSSLQKLYSKEEL